jgi:hypothetical protein
LCIAPDRAVSVGRRRFDVVFAQWLDRLSRDWARTVLIRSVVCWKDGQKHTRHAIATTGELAVGGAAVVSGLSRTCESS